MPFESERYVTSRHTRPSSASSPARVARSMPSRSASDTTRRKMASNGMMWCDWLPGMKACTPQTRHWRPSRRRPPTPTGPHNRVQSVSRRPPFGTLASPCLGNLAPTNPRTGESIQRALLAGRRWALGWCHADRSAPRPGPRPAAAWPRRRARSPA